MANQEHVAKLTQSAYLWNEWRDEHPEIQPDLAKACLRTAILGDYDRNAAAWDVTVYVPDLGRANLSGADLTGANLIKANLLDANLSGANLTDANLSEAMLHRANLSGAMLRWAILSGAYLDGADLSEARLLSTIFANVDLSKVVGLQTVIHEGPSSIGIDTIYKSKGNVPHIFLRGAGIPENLIEYMASLVGAGIEFYSLFISYSTKDQRFADRLFYDLRAKGVRCWFAPRELLGGKKVHTQIDQAIRIYDKLLLVLSPASMASEWVRTEIALARKREKEENKEILFPISLCPFSEIRKWEYFDSDLGKDSAREIREYHIPGFTNWESDHKTYQRELDKLLRALNEKPRPITSG